MGHEIGRLERVALREVWRHEAYDFTQWLETNIDVLNAIIELNLVNVERERAAGSFSIDLVAEDEGGGKVIIENQLERSNHDHLGKVLTYLTAMNAKAAIWIVSDPRPEHVAAISWLNENSSASFYLIKVEAVRIGESQPAPLLTTIVAPAEEKGAVAETNKEFAKRHEQRHRWWSIVVKHPEARLHRHNTPGQLSWLGAGTGTAGLSFVLSVTRDRCTAELYIDRGKEAERENKSIFEQLHAHKDDIESAFGGALEWERLDGKRASRIAAVMDGGYRSPDEQWDDIIAEQVDAMNRLEKAIRPFLKSLRLGTPETAEPAR